jgi:hypothetical protein
MWANKINDRIEDHQRGNPVDGGARDVLNGREHRLAVAQFSRSSDDIHAFYHNTGRHSSFRNALGSYASSQSAARETKLLKIPKKHTD